MAQTPDQAVEPPLTEEFRQMRLQEALGVIMIRLREQVEAESDAA